jgi:hypothetical protein
MCIRNTCLLLDQKKDIVACDVPTFLKLVEKAEMMMQERRLILESSALLWKHNLVQQQHLI